MELIGIAALISILVELFKKLGIIPDGYAGLVAAIGDVLVFAILTVGGVFPGIDWVQIDQIAALIGQLILLIAGSVVIHKGARTMELPLFRK